MNYKYFNDLIPKIYPAGLVASWSGIDKDVEYLDVRIKVTNTGTVISVFHKLYNFNL